MFSQLEPDLVCTKHCPTSKLSGTSRGHLRASLGKFYRISVSTPDDSRDISVEIIFFGDDSVSLRWIAVKVDLGGEFRFSSTNAVICGLAWELLCSGNNMSETYDSYERQYFELSDKISRKCVSTALANGEEKKQMATEIKNGLDEAESLIRRMDLEARNLPPTQKAALLAGLRSHKADLTNLKGEAKKTLAARDRFAARDELMEGGMVDSDSLSADQRGRLLTATERLNQSGDRIKDSKRTLAETESLGVSTLAELDSQRQNLLRARDKLRDVDDNVGKSRRILIKMTRLMNRNKLIGWGLIIVLIFVILVVLYFKFKG